MELFTQTVKYIEIALTIVGYIAYIVLWWLLFRVTFKIILAILGSAYGAGAAGGAVFGIP